MTGIKWVRGTGPPPEAYSRVTNPERFEPLHRVALDYLEQLQERFDVERVDGYELEQELQRAALTRPSVKLIPADSRAAPLVVTFTDFPSVILRCGFWLVLSFPTCGCDACDETADGEVKRLTEAIDDVVAGRFRESIRIPLWGEAGQTWELGSSTRRMAGGSRITRSRARALINARRRTVDWSPWPKK